MDFINVLDDAPNDPNLGENSHSHDYKNQSEEVDYNEQDSHQEYEYRNI